MPLKNNPVGHDPRQGREMRRGRWRPSEDGGSATKRADRVIPVRMTEAEADELDAQVKTLGLSRNKALRIAARRIGGFVETDAQVSEALRDAVRQIGGIARNINQLAKTANRTKAPDFVRFQRHRMELAEELERVEGLAQRLLDLGKRRGDGLKRLEAARNG